MSLSAELVQAVRDPDNARRHAGPPLVIPAAAFVVAAVVAWALQARGAHRWCAFALFGSAFPLGVFTATAVSQLRWLGARVAGTLIALFGGFLAAANLAIGGLFLSLLALPAAASNVTAIRVLDLFMSIFSGVGYCVPVALLFAGLSIPCLILGLLPKWVSLLGLVLAVVGVLSWFAMVAPAALVLIPIVRVGGFFWLIAVAVLLPSRKA